MPGFDRTGPRGEGPMTGGGRGFCNPNRLPRGSFYRGFYGAGRGGIPWGGGRGRVWGGGRGRGRCYWWAEPYPNDFDYYGPKRPSPDDERQYLSDQLAALEDEVRDIKDRLKVLNAEEKKK